MHTAPFRTLPRCIIRAFLSPDDALRTPLTTLKKEVDLVSSRPIATA
jgi:hypothetical protein